MGFEDEREGERRRKSDRTSDREAVASSRPRKKKSTSAEVGDALRSIYDRTVEEAIPSEMLDLLGKLG